ncbi:MAG: molybdopterin-guanine dinucleotide biosynthesis protein B [Magnetococcales bacterium]|nr:molybdopterin-guanine dinucleotide biosynthesis protein B [Magnetococcales bacterium]
MPTLPPVIGFAAPSGSGKTTLLEQVIPLLVAAGLKVAAIKHGHHPADPDTPGKDTHRFRQAGAQTVLFSGPECWFMIQDRHRLPEPTLAQQVQRLTGHDLIVVEGYQEENHAKIVLVRREVGHSDWHQRLSQVVAVATDDPTLTTPVPTLPLNDPRRVAGFIQEWLQRTKPTSHVI